MTRLNILINSGATTAPVLAFLTLSASAIAPATNLAAQSSCPASQFLQARAAMSNYAAPSVQVSCTGSQVSVTSNGIPGYVFKQVTPTGLSETTQTTIFPQIPQLTGSTSRVAEQVGVSLQGLPINSGSMGPVPVAQAFGDAHYNNALDSCDGHTNPTTGYHLHGVTPSCIASQTRTADGEMVIGYALDGFPIVAGGNWVSGYVQTGNPQSRAVDAYRYNGKTTAATLDECNGRTTAAGGYQYHVTTQWPYTVGCFKGTTLMSGAPGGGNRGQRLEGQSRQPASGGQQRGPAQNCMTPSGRPCPPPPGGRRRQPQR